MRAVGRQCLELEQCFSVWTQTFTVSSSSSLLRGDLWPAVLSPRAVAGWVWLFDLSGCGFTDLHTYNHTKNINAIDSSLL